DLSIWGTASADDFTIGTNSRGELTLRDDVRGAAIPMFLDYNLQNVPVTNPLPAGQINSWNIYGFAGLDRYNIGAGDYARTIQSPVTVDGDDGIDGPDELTLDDSAATNNVNHYTLTDSTFRKQANRDNTLTYSGVGRVTVNTTAFRDDVSVD